MGYSIASKAYRIWMNDSRRIQESRDVIFNEELDDESNNNSTGMDQWFGIEGDRPTLGQLYLHLFQYSLP
jgi:hypothetical protein